MPGRRRTRQHIIADRAVNHVERQVLQAGNASDRVRNDYGIDLLVRTFDTDGFAESGVVGMQVKATDTMRLVGEREAVSTRIDVEHLQSWLDDADPVMLVIYDAAEDAAYWLDIREHYG